MANIARADGAAWVKFPGKHAIDILYFDSREPPRFSATRLAGIFPVVLPIGMLAISVWSIDNTPSEQGELRPANAEQVS